MTGISRIARISYYAVYFTGPDGLKFEFVHMPLAEFRCRQLGLL